MQKTTQASIITAKHLFCGLLALVVLAFAPAAALANGENGGEGEEKKFNPGELIIHHISDAHQIHIIGDISVPLPIILWTDKGLEVFSSSVFWDENHGTTRKYTSEKTGYTYENHHEKIIFAHEEVAVEVAPAHADTSMHHEAADSLHTDSLHTEHGHEVTDTTAHAIAPVSHETAHDEHAEHQPMDFSITKSVAGMLFILVLMVIIFRSIAKSYEKRKNQAPKGMQNLFEPFILFIRNEVAIPSIGKKKADRYVPFLLTVFFFIWMCNMLGLIPFIGGFNITGTLSVTLVLALLVFLITNFSGNSHYWMHILWPPGIPIGIKFILVPIEIMSLFIKPTVLMIRLTANIAAGHIIILAFVSLVLLFGQSSAVAGYGVGVGAVAFMIFMFFIELLVAFLQAYVFTLLAALYFGDATQEHHHDDEHH
jgi:F-type H+-transporting ATPase subunit a